MKTVSILLCMVAFAGAASASGPVTIVSNVGQTATSIESFGSAFSTNMSVAGAFKTDGTPGALSTVSIYFYGSTHSFGFGGLGPCVVSVCGDTNGTPGNTMAVLSGNNFPTNEAIYTFTNTNASPVLFQPRSQYWVVVSSPASVSNAVYSVGLIGNGATDTNSFWAMNTFEYKIGSESWFPNSTFMQMSVSVVPMPPPISVSLGTSGGEPVFILSYDTPDYQFGLKENPNPAATNWSIAAGSYRMSSTNTTVTVNAKPPKLFFRLESN